MAKCISIRNPISYLVAAGIKDVENRTWKTDFRGTLYIHSSGEDAAHCYFQEYKDLLPVQAELDILDFNEAGELVNDYALRVLGWDEAARQFYLKDKRHAREYELVKAYQAAIERGEDHLKAHAIIGRVELYDIVNNSKSQWAERACFHWLLKNAELFEKPILQVKGRLRLWELPKNILERM
jgi:hypothetical protein